MAEEKLPMYGGQAVIEGVMMRGRTHMAVAMRDPKGKIVLHSEELGLIYRSPLARIPFLRGLVLLWDALVLGSRALSISANTQAEEEEDKLEGWQLSATVLVSLAFAVGLFFLIPAGIGQWVDRSLALSPIASAVFEGVLRLAVLIGYLAVIARMEDIRRVYGYHGAEHKTINAFEAGAKLTPKEVEKFSREHPRCGTAFLLTVVVLSIIVFAFLGPMALLPRLAARVMLIPLLASLAYEYLRFTATHINNPIVKVLVIPNLALQRLTTRPPDESMLEVGIAAFKEMKRLEEEATQASA